MFHKEPTVHTVYDVIKKNDFFFNQYDLVLGDKGLNLIMIMIMLDSGG